MQIPVETSWRDIEPSAELEERIRRKAQGLERYFGQITGCRVRIEARHRHRNGDLYHVRVDLTVPGREIVVRRDPPEDHAHEDVVVAVRDAFKAARRRLQDYARERRGQTKAHEEPPHGRIARLFPEDGYGFLATADGREVYFHENAVVGGGFAKLRIGEEVRFLEEEGKRGPQATSVRRRARRRALR